MGRGVRVAADDSHAWKGESLLRTHNVNNTIVFRQHSIVRQSKVSGILCQRVNLFLRYRILNRLVLVVGWSIMVRHTVDMVWTETLQSSFPHSCKCLG